MFARLLLLFIGLPLADLVLLLILSKYTGVWTTISIVVVTGVTGALFARRQWRWLLERTRSRMHQNEVPSELFSDGFMILLGACLLITPGLLTDLIGFSMLIPRCRKWYRDRMKSWIRDKVQVVQMGGQPAENRDVSSDTVDGTARETPVQSIR